MKSKLFKTTLLLSTCALITLPCLITTSCSKNSTIFYQDDLLKFETYKIYLNRDTDYANNGLAGLFFNIDPLVVNSNAGSSECSIKIKEVNSSNEHGYFYSANSGIWNERKWTVWEFILLDEDKEYFNLECVDYNHSLEDRDAKYIYISDEVIGGDYPYDSDIVRSKWKSWHWKDPFLHFELRYYPWSKEDRPDYYYYQNISLEIINNTGGWI